MSESTFDVTALGEEMIDAARKAVGDRTPALLTAELELRRLAGVLADIASQVAKGELDPERARTYANIHRFSLHSVLRSVEGLSLLATEQALEAVLRVAGGVVNRVFKFKLL